MAQVVQLAESASEPATQALPQNVEAEAALLGALMIDNRLVEDVQLKLRAGSFLRTAPRTHLRSRAANDRREPRRQSRNPSSDFRN